jgi:hypothetical protein
VRLQVIAGLVLVSSNVLAGQHAIDLDNYRYRGRVVDTRGGPLPGVEVTCVARGDAPSRTKTDERGEYVLTSRHGVCGRLTFELSGFVPEGFARPGGDVLDVALELGGVGEIVCLDAKPRLPGRVTNADGSPAADASVWLHRLGGDRTWGARTDASGHFAMLAMCDRLEGELSLCARGKGEQAGAGCVTFAETKESLQAGVRIRLSR